MPGQVQHALAAEELPTLMLGIERLAQQLRQSALTSFFYGRGSMVMARFEGPPTPFIPRSPAILPDGQIAISDIPDEARWYYITQGRNVGVVQGE